MSRTLKPKKLTRTQERILDILSRGESYRVTVGDKTGIRDDRAVKGLIALGLARKGFDNTVWRVVKCRIVLLTRYQAYINDDIVRPGNKVVAVSPQVGLEENEVYHVCKVTDRGVWLLPMQLGVDLFNGATKLLGPYAAIKLRKWEV